MGTQYHKPKWPITDIVVSEGVTHDTVKLWDRGGLAGTLTFLAGHSLPFLQMLADTGNVAAKTYWGGERSGCVVNIDPTLHDDQALITPEGRITRVRELRAQAGRREK